VPVAAKQMRGPTRAMQSRQGGAIHRSGRVGWLRAAVLGSNDAIVSTASLMLGVAASSASKDVILVAGVAGLVAGAMSMAVGEYVSVSSQGNPKPSCKSSPRSTAGEVSTRSSL